MMSYYCGKVYLFKISDYLFKISDIIDLCLTNGSPTAGGWGININ